MRRLRSRTAITVAAVLAALAVGLLAPGLAEAQCAMCKTALTNSPEGRAQGAQFNAAILLMLFAPYVVVGTVASVLFRRQLGGYLGRLLRFRRFAASPPDQHSAVRAGSESRRAAPGASRRFAASPPDPQA